MLVYHWDVEQLNMQSMQAALAAECSDWWLSLCHHVTVLPVLFPFAAEFHQYEPLPPDGLEGDYYMQDVECGMQDTGELSACTMQQSGTTVSLIG
jgi:hypothetical protein